MDTGVLFLVITMGVAIGEYIAQIMLHKTAHMWVNQDESEDEQ